MSIAQCDIYLQCDNIYFNDILQQIETINVKYRYLNFYIYKKKFFFLEKKKVIMVYCKETSYETRISVLTWTTWQSSRKRLIEKKMNKRIKSYQYASCVAKAGKRERERKSYICWASAQIFSWRATRRIEIDSKLACRLTAIAGDGDRIEERFREWKAGKW